MVEALTCFQFSCYYQDDHLTLQKILSSYQYWKLVEPLTHLNFCCSYRGVHLPCQMLHRSEYRAPSRLIRFKQACHTFLPIFYVLYDHHRILMPSWYIFIPSRNELCLYRSPTIGEALALIRKTRFSPQR